jgi:hypothetical protein
LHARGDIGTGGWPAEHEVRQDNQAPIRRGLGMDRPCRDGYRQQANRRADGDANEGAMKRSHVEDLFLCLGCVGLRASLPPRGLGRQLIATGLSLSDVVWAIRGTSVVSGHLPTPNVARPLPVSKSYPGGGYKAAGGAVEVVHDNGPCTVRL